MVNYVRETMYEVYKNGELQQTRVGFVQREFECTGKDSPADG